MCRLIMGVLLVLSVAVSTVAAEKELYVYVDQNGNYHFSSKRLNENYRRIKLWKNRTFVRDLDAGKYDTFIIMMGRKYRIDHHLIKAVIKAESAWNPKAISNAGAQGLMQLMPGTAQLMDCDDVFDPAQNIEAGSRYLRLMLDEFDNDLILAIAAYNAGPGAVKKYRGVPPYKETRAYVKRVLTYYREYLSRK